MRAAYAERMHRLPFLSVPIVQAPMAGATSPELVAAVANAGGLGSLPGGYDAPDVIGERIARVRALTDRPFAVNLFVDTSPGASAEQLARANERLRPYREELGIAQPAQPRVSSVTWEGQLEAMFAARPAVFSFTFGIPDAAVFARCRELGIFTIGTAETVDQAVALERAGADAVCMQGFEAGGHHGTIRSAVDDALIGTLALVPQAVDAVRVPVLAAGGIGDGRGVAAVLALGAAAAQVGSAFLLADESAVPAPARAVLASDAARRTVLTNAFSGRYARGVRNRFIDEMDGDDAIAPYPFQHALTGDLRAAAAAAGRTEFLSMWAGQAVTLSRALPAAEIVRGLVSGAHESLAAARAALAELR